MTDIDIVLVGRLVPSAEAALDRAFTVHRLRDIANREEWLAEHAPIVRGVAVANGLPVDAAFVGALPNLEIVAGFGVGYDNIDARAAARRRVVVTNTPDVLTDEVADLAVGLLLATIRQIPQADRYLRAGKWLEKPFPFTATLRGRTVGIFGLGRIGLAIAERLAAFGVTILYHNRQPRTDVPFRYVDSLKGLAGEADVLIVATPGGEGTRHAVDAEVLAALGSDGVLVNIGRGSVVDEVALIAALEQGAILSAGLDVFADEPRVPQALIDLDRAVLLPHVGSASVHTRDAMGQLVVDNLQSWFAGKGPLTPVPETPVPPKS
ncbi:2-hydroxyacid dehydrogenase [Pseudochelatococcus lubricantis]|uniref:2-hydroxyacid dehydrogenase n=1 Tax=Pseudochelatococcus lubricantis TaxID=1538102 RepID=UPI0035EF8D1B